MVAVLFENRAGSNRVPMHTLCDVTSDPRKTVVAPALIGARRYCRARARRPGVAPALVDRLPRALSPRRCECGLRRRRHDVGQGFSTVTARRERRSLEGKGLLHHLRDECGNRADRRPDRCPLIATCELHLSCLCELSGLCGSRFSWSGRSVAPSYSEF
jgi:hypothetical protein